MTRRVSSLRILCHNAARVELGRPFLLLSKRHTVSSLKKGKVKLSSKKWKRDKKGREMEEKQEHGTKRKRGGEEPEVHDLEAQEKR